MYPNELFSSSLVNGLVKAGKTQHCQHFYLGKHLAAIAYLRCREGKTSALLLEFESIQSSLQRCIISRSDIVGGGAAVFTKLAERGYQYELEHQEAILTYLMGLGGGLPVIIAAEFDRITMDLGSALDRASIPYS